MEGNYYARRKFALFQNLMEHMGIEPGRLQFSWVSSAESTKFVQVVTEVTQAIKALGPNKTLVKTMPEVA
ncbi:MAG: hydrogenase iron-sulfur subunit [Deltaproteobacteria bacterium]|nr:hydrogenase iron-sulfur subunit [Deltaproteobacteria bacterium]